MMTIRAKRMPRSLPTTALSKPCQHCGTAIRGMPSQLATRKFCSQACVGLSRKAVRKKEWVTISCQVCGKEFEVTPGWTRNGRRKYCSRTCSGRSALAGRRLGVRHTDESRAKMSAALGGTRTGRRGNAWKGGRWTSQEGYVHVAISELPEDQQAIAREMVPTKPYILEHRLVAAVKAGRPLTRAEVVHHLNGEKQDNRPENLVLLDQQSHSLSHRMIDRELRQLRERVRELEAENAALKSRST